VLTICCVPLKTVTLVSRLTEAVIFRSSLEVLCWQSRKKGQEDGDTVREGVVDAVMWIVAYRNSNGTPAALTSGSRTTDFSIF
jgi:hypothetical protein